MYVTFYDWHYVLLTKLRLSMLGEELERIR